MNGTMSNQMNYKLLTIEKNKRLMRKGGRRPQTSEGIIRIFTSSQVAS